MTRIAPPIQDSETQEASRGFTLVEMLVVIAIIAILAVLIFPVTASVMERAQRIRCMSNLRQVVASTLSYAAANDGYLMPLRTPNGSHLFDGHSAAGGRDNTSGFGFLVNEGYIDRKTLRCPGQSYSDLGRPGTYWDLRTAGYVYFNMNTLLSSDRFDTFVIDPIHVIGNKTYTYGNQAGLTWNAIAACRVVSPVTRPDNLPHGNKGVHVGRLDGSVWWMERRTADNILWHGYGPAWNWNEFSGNTVPTTMHGFWLFANGYPRF